METPQPLKRITNTAVKVLASGLGSGYSPAASGTAGSLLAALIFFFLFPDSNFYNCLITTAVLAISIPCCTAAEKLYGKKDDSHIVLDEFLGMWISLLFLPHSFIILALAFFLFRFFDVTKVLFANSAQSLPGGWGIVADDVIAGIWSNITLQILWLIYNL